VSRPDKRKLARFRRKVTFPVHVLSFLPRNTSFTPRYLPATGSCRTRPRRHRQSSFALLLVWPPKYHNLNITRKMYVFCSVTKIHDFRAYLSLSPGKDFIYIVYRLPRYYNYYLCSLRPGRQGYVSSFGRFLFYRKRTVFFFNYPARIYRQWCTNLSTPQPRVRLLHNIES